MLKYKENILYFSYIPYFIDIELFSIYGLIVIKYWVYTILVFTLNPINMDLCIVEKLVNEHNVALSTNS
jgi:hypothetical protein